MIRAQGTGFPVTLVRTGGACLVRTWPERVEKGVHRVQFRCVILLGLGVVWLDQLSLWGFLC